MRVSTIDEYVKLLNTKNTSSSSIKVEGLCSRILRGKKPEDFLTLTDDPTRKIVMLIDETGLEKLIGKTGYEMLIEVGYEPDYLEHKVKEGNQFKLVLFPKGGSAKLATWDNVLDMVKETYPIIDNYIEMYRSHLKKIPFEQIEQLAGFSFLEVEKDGKQNDRYMTFERFMKSTKQLQDFRAFLYFIIHLRELFSGDGYTYTADGKRGVKEYIILNKPLSELGDYRMIDIDVKIPMLNKNIGGKSMLKTSYEQIVSIQEIGQSNNSRKLNELLKLANEEQLTPSVKDSQQVLLLAIDMQNDFMENGALPVPGSHGDVECTTRFIYNNMDKISRIAVSLDTHQPFQIFHPCWFIDKNGNNPPPYTMISVKDLDDGIWFPVIRPKETREYIEGLSSTPGKKVLMIWTYHCIHGTFGGALENQFSNMVYFHSVAKKSIVERLVKGIDPMTEMYGIIKPEYDPKNFINIDFLNKLEKYDKVVVVGEAKSHCCLESIKQILEYFANRPEITSKMYLLEDCMSSIPGFEDQTNQAFADFKKKYHVNLVKSTDNIL